MNEEKLLRFGTCEVDVLRHEVRRDGQVQAVAPKVFALLVYLLRERHRVVRKQELLDAIWQRRDVSDSVLARTVMEVRRAIADSADQNSRIKTVHGLGYRFVGDVFESAAPQGVARPVDLGSLVPTFQGRLRVGLLPCRNETGDPSLDWARYGLMVLVGHALESDARIDVLPLAVIRQAVGDMHAKLPVSDCIQLALRSLGMDRAVQASLRRHGHALCLDYQIAAAGAPAISGSIREGDPVLLGERFARAVNAALFPGTALAVEFESRDPFVNHTFARAIEQYVESQFESAMRMMAAVCDMEPHSTEAQIWHLNFRALTGDPAVRAAGESLLAQATAAGNVRLQAYTHLVLGFVIGRTEGPVEAVQEHLNAAVAVSRRHGDADWVSLIRFNFARNAAAQGRYDLARDLFGQARAGFRATGNPLYLGIIDYHLAQLSWNGGESAEALKGFECALESLRTNQRDALAMQALAQLAEVNASFGHYQRAESQCREALASIGRLQDAPAAATIVGRCAGVLASRGGLVEVERALEQVAPWWQDPKPAIRGPLAVAQGWRDFLRGDRRELRRRALELAEDRRIDPMQVHSLLMLWLRAEDLSQDGEAIEQARRCVEQRAERADALCLRTMLACSQAREACARGDVDAALAALGDVVRAWPFGPLPALARLNAAWLHLERGELADARSLLDDTGAWSTEHPAGLAVQARLAWESGDAAGAVSLQRRAISTFRGPASRWHLDLLEAYVSAARVLPGMPRLISESFFPVMR
jgi:DNA-binding winged helix-turn-helix (wHTH) protein/tetratricopeptide (TPR) repeat protein